MEISRILEYIDIGQMALPEFQRGYVWNRKQVRELFDSLYHRHPVGGLLVWATESSAVDHRGSGQLASGIVKLLLDGQQRITSLYGVDRGKPPEFFDGNQAAFTGLKFHLEDESFEFYQPVKMKDDPLWIDVSELMAKGTSGISHCIARLSASPEHGSRINEYMSRLLRLLGVREIDLHIDEVTGADKSLDVVVDIFNRVNSGGTKLSHADLALAKICADWPEARNEMKARLETWREAGYEFTLDWLLRAINTVATGKARFDHLHGRGAEEIEGGLHRAAGAIDSALNMIGGRLGLDHKRVLFGRFAIPVMVRYLDRRGAALGEHERDKLLFWYVQAGMWGRFSGSVEAMIDQDLAAIEEIEGGLDRLLDQLRHWRGSLWVEPDHFHVSTLGARFYPVLYMLTRMGEARDWGTGLALKAEMLGKMSVLEVHHIFPSSRLYDHGYSRTEVNALGNFCFLTKGTNLSISNRLPEAYFPEIEAKHPSALASQWIPTDPTLWQIDNYRDFLEARKTLLAEETNRRLAALLHGDGRWLQEPARGTAAPVPLPGEVLGCIADEEEKRELEALNEWVAAQDLPRGELAYDFADGKTGEQKAVFDLAWPNGLQPGLSQPVAVLLAEGAEVIALANDAGYRCFTTPASFRRHVEADLLSRAESG